MLQGISSSTRLGPDPCLRAEHRWHIAFVWLDLCQAFHLHSTKLWPFSFSLSLSRNKSNQWATCGQIGRRGAAAFKVRADHLCPKVYDRNHCFCPLRSHRFATRIVGARASHAKVIGQTAFRLHGSLSMSLRSSHIRQVVRYWSFSCVSLRLRLMLYRIKMRFGSVTQDTSLPTPTRAGKTFRLLTTAKSYVYNVFRLAYDKNGRGKK